MDTVDFKKLGDHAAELRQYALASDLWEGVANLESIAKAGKPKFPRLGERFEVASARVVIYNLQRMAAEFDHVAANLIAMVGELPDDEPAAATDEPTASGGMPLKDAYKHAAKDAPPGAADMVVTDSGGLFMSVPTSWRDKITTHPAARSAMDKLLGRKS